MPCSTWPHPIPNRSTRTLLCLAGSSKQYFRAIFDKVNIEGSQTIVKACRQAGVPRLVLTSSASVLYSGVDLHNGDESLPYAAQPQDYYARSKIEQEKVQKKGGGGGSFVRYNVSLTVDCPRGKLEHAHDAVCATPLYLRTSSGPARVRNAATGSCRAYEVHDRVRFFFVCLF